jgi:hypothetical protein
MQIKTVSRRLGLVLGAALFVGSVAAAWAQLEISSFTVDSGGTSRASGGAYALAGTIGQPEAGQLSGGSYVLSGGFWFGGGGVSGVEIGPDGGVDGPDPTLPLVFQLLPTSPNPVREEMTLAFDLPEASVVRVRLYDTSGRLVQTLADGPFPAGRHRAAWNRRDQAGERVPAGIYFLRFDAGAHDGHQKVVVVF